MSTFIVANRPEALYVWTDGAAYLNDGTVISILPKVEILPFGAGLLFCRGDYRQFRQVWAFADLGRPDLDSLVSGPAGLVTWASSVHGMRRSRSGADRPMEIGLAGWSEKRQRLETHLWLTHELWGASVKPGVLNDMTEYRFLCASQPDEAHMRALGWWPTDGSDYAATLRGRFLGDASSRRWG